MDTKQWVVFCGGSGLKGFLLALTDAAAATAETRRSEGSSWLFNLVVAVSDDGGSSRAIIDAFGGVAVGDCRNVALTVVDSYLAALAQSPEARAQHELTIVADKRQLLSLLTTRLLAACDAVASEELRVRVIPKIRNLRDCATAPPKRSAEESATKWTFAAACDIVLSALQSFLDAVEIRRMFGVTFSFRNASVGNLVICGLLFAELKARKNSMNSARTNSERNSAAAVVHRGLLKCAVDRLLFSVFDVGGMALLLGLSVSVVPALDYAWVDEIGSHTPVKIEKAASGWSVFNEGKTLPSVTLCGARRTGEVLRGQRCISYGVASEDDSEPLLTNKGSHAEMQPHCSKKDARQIICKLLLTDAGVNVLDGVRLVAAAGIGNLLRQPSTTIVLARGSLYTSTLAAAWPFFVSSPVATPTTTSWHDPLPDGGTSPSALRNDVVLMCNGCPDFETQHVTSIDELVEAVEEVLHLADSSINLHITEAVLPLPEEEKDLEPFWLEVPKDDSSERILPRKYTLRRVEATQSSISGMWAFCDAALVDLLVGKRSTRLSLAEPGDHDVLLKNV